ncbi:MAG: phosphatase PAP2 family protein [Gammaproteobacteria bacterium]
MSQSTPRVLPYRLLPALLCLASFLSPPCNADQLDGRALLTDAKLYFTAPVRWDSRDWMFVAGTALAIGAAHEYDDNVRAHFAGGSQAAPAGKDPKSTRDAVPALAIVGLTLGMSAILGDAAGYRETGSMLEAAAFTAVSSTILKLAAGRVRPNETAKVDDWRNGGDSFPSMHTSLTWAIGTVLAESGGDDYRWVRRALGYGIAGAVSYARVRENVHWASDTVAGAALGFATAQFVMGRRNPDSRESSFNVVPVERGMMLTYRRSMD